MKKSNAIGILAVVSMAVPSIVSGAGFSIYETGARGIAMGGAVVGSTGDATANFYNPANLTEVDHTELAGGLSILATQFEMDYLGVDDISTKAKDRVFGIPSLMFATPINDTFYFGFGIYTEFGLGTEYPKNWPMHENSTSTDLVSLTLNPNLAMKITDRLSVAIGARVMWFDFETNLRPMDNAPVSADPPILGTTDIKIGGDSWGFGYDAGLTYKITDELSFGATFKSRIHHVIHGSVDVSSSTVPSIPGILPSGSADASGEIDTPPSLTLGMNWMPDDGRWNIGVAATYTFWSTFDNLDIYIEEPLPSGYRLPDIHSKRSWKDVCRFGFGVERIFDETWSGQIGYVFDMCPTNTKYGDTMIPAGRRHIFSAGVGYKTGAWTWNGAYSLVYMVPSSELHIGSTNFRVDNGFCNILSLSVARAF